MKTSLLALAILVCSAAAQAEVQYSFVVHTFSKHGSLALTAPPAQSVPQLALSSGGFEVGSYTQPGLPEVHGTQPQPLPSGTPMPKPGAHTAELQAPSAQPAARKAMFKFNEVNPGVAIRAEFDQDWSVQGGVYKNSYYKTTLYGVVQYTPLHVAGVRLGGFVGLGTGYTAHSAANVGPFSLLGGAVAIAQVGNASVAVRVVPKLSSGTTGVRTLELGYRF